MIRAALENCGADTIDTAHLPERLVRHALYLNAVLGEGRFTIAEAIRKLGYTGPHYHAQTDTGKERERLMAAAGWPAETLTLEELRSRL